MKRSLILLLAAALVLSIWGFSATEQTPTDPIHTTAPSNVPTSPTACPHALELVQTVPAGCTKPGQRISTCTLCGEEFTEETPAIGHSFTDASCTATPLCTICGYTSGSALGHAYTDGICTRCGDELPQDTPSDCQHDYVLTSQTAATCTKDGSMEYKCGICQHTYTQTISANGHRFSDATCTAPKTCIVCDHTDGSAPNHSYQDGKCSRCGEADPSIPVEVTFTVTVRSDKGKPAEGVTVRVYTTADTPAAIGRTNSKGVASITLLSAKQYRVTLSDIPEGLSAKESYTFSSTRVNINLSTVSVITPTDHSKANYKVGSVMGDFTLTDTDGNSYTLSQLLKEKNLVILNFWFVNCSPCKAEFPYFETVYNKYDNVQLLTLNHIDSENQIQALREQMGVTFPMIQENIGFQDGFGITAYPTTVFIDSSGRILKIQVGDFKNQQELEQMIQSFLK